MATIMDCVNNYYNLTITYVIQRSTLRTNKLIVMVAM